MKIWTKYTWVEREAKIQKGDGTVIDYGTVQVPDGWSQNAVNVIASKYMRRSDVPPQWTMNRVPVDGMPSWLWPSIDPVKKEGGSSDWPGYGETSARQVFHRMAGCWTYWGWRGGYFDTEADALAFYEACFSMLAEQIAAPNSPQWFNTGLNWAYGITGEPQGHWYVCPKTGEARRSEDAYTRPQPHACFIQGVSDDLVNEGGIMDLWTREARLFKYGSGTGANFSDIRGENEPLSGGGKSSGLMSFLAVGDRAAGAIKSGGTTRRAAKMVCLDVDHPDIEAFISWKTREEEKVAALVAGSSIIGRHLDAVCSAYASENQDSIDRAVREAEAAGVAPGLIARVAAEAEQCVLGSHLPALDLDWQGEAYRTVGGQNANNSVRVTDDFMRAARDGEDWELRNRTDGKVCRTVDASGLLDEIAYHAWASADPGLQYDTTINAWHTCQNDGPIRASNPCSEYMFLDDTACNLASLNLVKFLRENEDGVQTFLGDAFVEACHVWITVLDISVSMAQFPSREIAERSYAYRTLGLGYANLGALLMRMGLPYASREARGVCTHITALMQASAILMSDALAQRLGPFPAYERNKQDVYRVIKEHAKHTAALDAGSIDQQQALRLWHNITAGLESGKLMQRNAQLTVIAPTGTIGLVMDCDTTGIEPDFALVKLKTLAGGGTMKIVNQSVAPALRSLGYDQNAATNIEKWIGEHGTVFGCPYLRDSDHAHVFATASGEGAIAPTGHLAMMAAAQPFLSGAISKTINMPNDATVDDVRRVFVQAWKLGLKAISVYRDGSKLSQPLSTGKAEKPKETAASTANDDRFGPYCKCAMTYTHNTRNRLPGRRNGYTQKMTIGGHKLYLRTGEYEDGTLGEVFIDAHKVGATMHGMLDAFAQAVSIGLQYGVPLEEFVSAFTFTKFEPAGMVQGHDRVKMAGSMIDAIFRDLAIHYLGRNDLAHVSPNDAMQDIEHVDERPDVVSSDAPRYSGDACPECQNFTLVRNGTCMRCVTCGGTTGCS